MRAKTIFEKFKEDSDPICDLGIGSFKHNINFTSKKELFNYIIKIIPNILKTKKIPDDILKMGYKSSVYFKEDKIKNNIYEIRKH